MNKPEIYDVQYNELALCAQAIRAAFAPVATSFHLNEENCPTNAAFMKIERLHYDWDKGNKMYAVKENGCIAGFMQLEKRDGGSYELKNICVVPEYRHHGIGRMLLDFAKQQVKAQGGSKITIGIIEEYTVLKQWYEQNGFVHLGTKKFEHLPFVAGFMECVIA